MATRSIVTSQPDVACDVCERRLLRGEQPDAFLAAGRRRIVCELCAPRAVQEGWLRETESRPLSMPALRPRRGRNLLDRLRQAARPADGPSAATLEEPPVVREREAPSYDFLDGYAAVGAEPLARQLDGEALLQREAAEETPGEEVDDATHAANGGEVAGQAPAEVLPTHSPEVTQAVEAFNVGEHPRRVAGVARSLGAPLVSVAPSEHARSVVRIVVAWELCWYRYEIDLDDTPPQALVIAQGTELNELAHEDLLANAVAEESGTLLLSAG